MNLLLYEIHIQIQFISKLMLRSRLLSCWTQAAASAEPVSARPAVSSLPRLQVYRWPVVSNWPAGCPAASDPYQAVLQWVTFIRLVCSSWPAVAATLLAAEFSTLFLFDDYTAQLDAGPYLFIYF